MWDASPRDARWYGEVICEPEQGGDVDYFSGYSDRNEVPNVELLVPLGWIFLESTVQAIPVRK